MTDMFFGLREGRVTDPFGNVWTIATLKEEVAPEEMQRRMMTSGKLLSCSLVQLEGTGQYRGEVNFRLSATKTSRLEMQNHLFLLEPSIDHAQRKG